MKASAINALLAHDGVYEVTIDMHGLAAGATRLFIVRGGELFAVKAVAPDGSSGTAIVTLLRDPRVKIASISKFTPPF